MGDGEDKQLTGKYPQKLRLLVPQLKRNTVTSWKQEEHARVSGLRYERSQLNYRASNHCPAPVRGTVHPLAHLIITRTHEGRTSGICISQLTQLRSWGPVLCPWSLWVVVEARPEFVQSSSRGFFHLPCSWHQCE